MTTRQTKVFLWRRLPEKLKVRFDVEVAGRLRLPKVGNKNIARGNVGTANDIVRIFIRHIGNGSNEKEYSLQ